MALLANGSNRHGGEPSRLPASRRSVKYRSKMLSPSLVLWLNPLSLYTLSAKSTVNFKSLSVFDMLGIGIKKYSGSDSLEHSSSVDPRWRRVTDEEDLADKGSAIPSPPTPQAQTMKPHQENGPSK